jgi:thiamine-monophosphate kinase
MSADPRARAWAAAQPKGGEAEVLARLQELLPLPPAGEVWFGDDTAVVRVPGPGPADGGQRRLLLASDGVIVGMDADLSLTTLADLGWKAMAINLSDIAAMGGRPSHALVSVAGLKHAELEELYEGILAASSEYSCPVVGGDLSGGPAGFISVAIMGWVEGAPVLRSGARPHDTIWVTGPLGAAAAGLRLLREQGPGARPAELAAAHARPKPALTEGEVARSTGVTAMIDVSDGLVTDVAKLATASGVGFELFEAQLPIASGATLEEALGGGEDYVLAFAASPRLDISGAFYAAGLPPPYRVGTCTGGPSERLLDGKVLPLLGWEHEL